LVKIVFVCKTFTADKQKWTYLDQDGDRSLSYDEFRKFLRPEDDNDLRKIEINSIIKEYDDDNDGKVSPAEYLKMTGIFIQKKIRIIKKNFILVFFFL
jgi:Ca2+-binding EF-hand superfamily protein